MVITLSKIFFHIDVNNAFLSWEAVKRLNEGETTDLRTIPSAIAGDPKKRTGVILAKSPIAKKMGVKTGEPLFSAIQKCPNLVCVSPNHEYYEEQSKKLKKFLEKYSDEIEPYSIDECFIAHIPLLGTPLEVANKIKDDIYITFGYTVNIGISDTKYLAKIASDFEKPNKIHTLYPEEMPTKMWPLPVRDLFLIGAATEAKLNRLGIYTIGDLAKVDLGFLRKKLGKHGETVWHFANGRNADAVTPDPEENKGYGNSTTTAQDVVTRAGAQQVLLSLCETVAARMRKDGKCGRCVSIHLRTNEFQHSSHQTMLEGATNITAELFKAACGIFDEAWDRQTPLRQLGVQVTRLTEEPYQQYDLFSGMSPVRYERKLRLDEAVDALRDKFGEDIIRRAKFAHDPENHMMGGLDKARRTGVTKPVPKEFEE